MKKILTLEELKQLDTNSKLEALIEAIVNSNGKFIIGNQKLQNTPHDALKKESNKQLLKCHFERKFLEQYPFVHH